jgi:cysteinyl-tRNA synthetase
MPTSDRSPSPAALLLEGAPLRLTGRTRVYVCGITPYDVTHLGHAATFVWTDLLARVVQLAGLEVEVCRNVTDVDDTLTAAARRKGEHYDAFAAVQQFYFDRDMAALGVQPPAHEPRAHRYVPQVVRLAAALLDAGAAYERDGTVRFAGAGVVAGSGLDRDSALRLLEEYGDRPADPAKDDPADVALWVRSEPGEPAWESPWGPGRPGWHAECAAMALSVFGPALDVHAGGRDLHFPHHAYQAAIAEAVTGVTPFARAHLQVGTVHVAGAKMAKSTGNLVLVGDLLRDVPAAAVRLLLLDRAWGEDWTYRAEDLDASAGRLERLYAAAGRSGGSAAAGAAVTSALLDDLDVPRALQVAEDAGGEAARAALATLGLLGG